MLFRVGRLTLMCNIQRSKHAVSLPLNSFSVASVLIHLLTSLPLVLRNYQYNFLGSCYLMISWVLVVLDGFHLLE